MTVVRGPIRYKYGDAGGQLTFCDVDMGPDVHPGPNHAALPSVEAELHKSRNHLRVCILQAEIYQWSRRDTVNSAGQNNICFDVAFI